MTMPEPDLPPTPATSTDLVGQQRRHSKNHESSFVLPPPAIFGKESKSPAESSTIASSCTSPSSYQPVSPISPTPKSLDTNPRHKKTASGGRRSMKDDFSLPPPPTRSRKIIQVQPKYSSTNTGSSGSSNRPSSSAGTSPTSKRKTPSASSVAGRKIARRTAHSIIERRRRSKMNEEFDTLKDMIPACEGQEMHKLAILQASIEYTRYLEDCVKDLRGRNSKEDPRDASEIHPSAVPFETRIPTNATSLVSPRMATQPFRRTSTIASFDSPDIAASVSSSHTGTASSSTSTATTPTHLSPAFQAIHFSPEMSRQQMSTTASTATSPNLLPQAAIEIDQDHHDATTALMMLNNDRRGLGKRGLDDEDMSDKIQVEVVKRRPTGMSVKDLLSA